MGSENVYDKLQIRNGLISFELPDLIRFVRLSVHPVTFPANNFKTTVDILNKLDRLQWGEEQNPRTIILPCICT